MDVAVLADTLRRPDGMDFDGKRCRLAADGDLGIRSGSLDQAQSRIDTLRRSPLPRMRL